MKSITLSDDQIKLIMQLMGDLLVEYDHGANTDISMVRTVNMADNLITSLTNQTGIKIVDAMETSFK